MAPTLVIADDDPLLREVVRGFVELEGRYAVCGEAGDGRRALDLVDSHDPDLLLLDLDMPVMDGLQVLRTLGGQQRPHVVVLTGDASKQVLAAELGAHAVLLKGHLDTLLPTLAAAASDGGPPDRREDPTAEPT